MFGKRIIINKFGFIKMYMKDVPTHTKHRKYVYAALCIAAVGCLTIGLIGHDSSEYNGDAATNMFSKDKQISGLEEVIGNVT